MKKQATEQYIYSKTPSYDRKTKIHKAESISGRDKEGLSFYILLSS